MATTNTAEGQLQYLMLILKNTDMPKPDYQSVALDAGINNANNAQKRFKKIVEDAGYTLVDGKVTAPGGGGAVAAAPIVGIASKIPRKPRAKKNGADTLASKKRKLAEKDAEEDNAAGEDDDGGVADIKDEADAEASVSATAGEESG